ncbi:MAG: hypothetical protein FWH38_06735 [Treponema sp.]|nr:hypothetical protein [Treponema sp.]
MYKPFLVWVLVLSVLSVPAGAEQFRALVAGSMELSADNPEGSSISLNYSNSALLRLGTGIRFLRGIELELSAPQAWLSYQGSLAVTAYAELDRVPSTGVNDLEGRRILFEPLPGKIKNVYQIPVRQSHGLRTSPYATVTANTALPSSFPVLFRLMPIIKGMSDELEKMPFLLNVRPILSDEGEVKITARYPEQLRGRPFTLLIDDVLVENLDEERLLKEGEHHLVVLSDDYRNESRRFVVEKAKRTDLVINLQDPTPLIIFEGPENARIFLNNSPVSRNSGPIPVEPGVYEAKFQVGDYTLTKTVTVQRGKTYKVALAVGIEIEENQ